MFRPYPQKRLENPTVTPALKIAYEAKRRFFMYREP